jgi:alpha-glucosidase (family GH31 glycosyl hydrolase)
VRLNDGLLSRSGWYVLDDTATVLLTSGIGPGYTVRPAHAGLYQDWYLFGYGHDYLGALGDLRALTGPAPLLPRGAFGVWFSRYYPYSEQDYHDAAGHAVIHPSISTDDPKYPAADAQAGGLATSSGQCRILIADPMASCAVFDWTKPAQIAAYFALHQDFERAGADVFWLDWCCDDSSAVAPGLTADTWINSLYAPRQRAR